MIKQLCERNSALIELSQQLSCKEATTEDIKRCIKNLISQILKQDERQKSQYYYLISEIYAFRFQNIEDAQNQLKQLDDSIDTQITLNCELRMAHYKYFQQKYKQAFQHLDIALGYVQQELKLIDNAKFFFQRIIKKENLVIEAKQNKSFQAIFILSLIYENQKQQLQAFEELKSFLNQSKQGFQKFQIFKRLLQLYDTMKKNSVSTISISKKSLQTYKEQLSFFQTKNQNYQQNYDFKCKFIMKIINFMKTEENKNKQKLLKKMLDLKLLAYFKLKKCIKLTQVKEVKLTLQKTIKLIKQSKDTQMMQSTLNYDFVKNEYDKYKIFYKLTSREQLLKWKVFSSLINFSPRKVMNNSPRKDMRTDYINMSFNPSSILKNPKQSILKNQTQKSKVPSQSVYTPVENKNSVNNIYQPVYNSTIPSKPVMMKSTSPFVMKHTQSEDFNTNQSDFQGSVMIKIHASSQGHQERYFYVKLDKLKQKPRLFYSTSKKSQGSSDSYYSLKGLQKIDIGKKASAFKRKDTAKFNQDQCFTLMFDDGKDRSFYVPNEDDFHRWIVLLQTKILYSDFNSSKIPNKSLYKTTTVSKMQRQDSPPSLKKSKKVIQI